MSTPKGSPVDKWQWLHLVASEHGPREATTRHVLHALALHMQPDGGNAWPSQAHLAMRTRLSERTVGAHLRKAEEAGWIVVYDKWPKGHGWKLHEYQAAVPAKIEDQVPAHPWEEDSTWRREEPRSGRSANGKALPGVTGGQRPANDAQRPERGATTSGTLRPNVRNDVPTNSPITLPINYPEEGGLAGKPTTLEGFVKKVGESLASREGLIVQLHKAVQQFPSIEDAKLAQAYQTDLATVQAARRAVR